MSSFSYAQRLFNSRNAGLALLTTVTLGLAGCASLDTEPPARPAAVSHARTLAPQVERLASFEVGQDRAPISELEAFISKCNPAMQASLERDLLVLLDRPALSMAAKEIVLRLLARVGTKESIPSLVRLLGDGYWSPYALQALQLISGPEADVALLKSLSEIEGSPRLALINAIGRRQLQAAVPSLALLLRSDDPLVVKASLNALGFLGSPAALIAIRDQKLPAVFRDDRSAAMVALISRIAEAQAMPADLATDAAARCRSIIASDAALTLRSAALAALLRLEGDAALGDLNAALKDSSSPFAMCATRTLLLVRPPQTAKMLADAWASLPVEVRTAAIGILAEAKDPSARAFALASLDSSEESLRIASVAALGSVGTVGDFDRLFALAESKNDLGTAAVASLSHIADPAVSGLLRAKLNQAAPATTATIFSISAARADREVFPMACSVIENASVTDVSLRAAAVSAAGSLAQPSDMPRLVGILLTLSAPGEIRVLEKAFPALATVHDNPAEAAYLLLAAMNTATAAQKRPLRHALAVLDTPEARNYFVKILEAGPGDEWRDAIRAMGNSKLFAHVAPMIEASKKAANPADKRLGARSVILLISSCGEVDVPQRGDAYLSAWQLTDRDDERLEILKELDWMRPVEAVKFRAAMKH